jgi:beta-lactamase class A
MEAGGGGAAGAGIHTTNTEHARMKKTLFLIILLLSSAALASDEDWKPLNESVDPDLQMRLEERLNQNPDWATLIASRKMAIGLVDLSQATPRFARVNGNKMMYAASLPKIAILLATYVSFEDGSLQETAAVHVELGNMIRVSSNSAASHLIEQVGMKKIQAVLKDPQYGFYDEQLGGGLWIGRLFAKRGPRIGDPINNISHGASATQVCRFFYLLASGRLINPERSEQMLADLSHPKLHHKFVSQVEERAPGAMMFRKSGTWRQWHSDAIMVRGNLWRNYILVGLIENANGEAILRQVLPAVEELIVPPEYAEGHDDF